MQIEALFSANLKTFWRMYLTKCMMRNSTVLHDSNMAAFQDARRVSRSARMEAAFTSTGTAIKRKLLTVVKLA